MILRHVCAALTLLAVLLAAGCHCCRHSCAPPCPPAVSSAPPCCPDGAGPVQSFSGGPVYHP
jgi:hypothetical protein